MLEFEALLGDAACAAALRAELIREAYEGHVETNAAYRRYAAALGVDPAAGMPNLDAVPLLPSSVFKRPDLTLASVPDDEIIKRCTSSGTSGSRSVVPRDETTLGRFLGSITAALPALFRMERAGRHRGIVLGPTTAEAGDLWFSYAIACLTLVMQTEYFEAGGVFAPGQASDAIAAHVEAGLWPAVIGPPARVLAVCREVANRRTFPPFPAGGFVITAGGWKGDHARAIRPDAFRAEVRAALQVPDASQIRDSYNMVELNSTIHECAAHHKHVPPWVEVQARDPATNRVLEPGREGILAFLDPSATSYPCFILSEDFGVVFDGTCPCGRAGARLRVTRRLNRVEARGCALKMAVGGAPTAAEGADRFFLSAYRDPRVGR